RLDKLIAKQAADAKAKGIDLPPIPAFTVHDIRRSVATGMAELGVSVEHIERVLGHELGGVAGTYNVHDYFPEKLAALELWGKQWS
ncbi:MAG TPA: tyrosine-type recombinase/integrase, partial [Sphingomicrobium sp.]|nr:tyrosine-type recombinase/integrase [Sphingomicrobium sp.]